ncbi:MAG: type II toxin-antitoxin system HicB family antitoxin [Methanophagales archaeon ANME-1-THS]|nr:MAG: type II toxin-antitoxin system HicB family antitoxin [Methanophagales archaeon ANME-1-THS]
MRIIFTALLREEREGGYSVLCPELGVTSQGESIEEAKKNIVEAVELYLESARDLGILEEILEDVGVDLKTAKEMVMLSAYISTPLQACVE